MKKIQNDERGIYWCNMHQREATYTDENGNIKCDPKFGGILFPCQVVYILTKSKIN